MKLFARETTKWKPQVSVEDEQKDTALIKMLTARKREAKTEQLTQLQQLKIEEAKVTKALTQKIQNKNLADVYFTAEVEAKRSKLSELELERKKYVSETQKLVEMLETRKKAALTPITAERVRLEATREALASEHTLLEERKQEIENLDKQNRIATQDLAQLQVETRKAQALAGKTLERQRLQTLTLRTEYKRLRKDIQQASEAQQVEAEKIEEKRDLLKIEMNKLRAQVVKAEQAKLAQVEAQKQVDEKRRMLKQTIDLLKQKGLWHKAKEMKIR